MELCCRYCRTCSEFSEGLLESELTTAGLPALDLFIRTGGEKRISNFLLWQIAYAELYISDTLWPDFSREEYVRILKDYQGRERRYGKVDA